MLSSVCMKNGMLNNREIKTVVMRFSSASLQLILIKVVCFILAVTFLLSNGIKVITDDLNVT